MNVEKNKKLNKVLLIVLGVVCFVNILLFFIYKLRPKETINFEGFKKDMDTYLSKLSVIKSYEIGESEIFYIYIDQDVWRVSKEIDKATFCNNVNKGITAICYQYGVLESGNEYAYVVYKTESGLTVARPEGLSYEVEIIY